jgi:phosphoribosylglycinamide formyltransferase-1
VTAAMYRVGWFSTGRDKAARDLLEVVHGAIERGDIGAEISFVFSNREPGESDESDRFFKLVEGYSIPLVCFSYQRFKTARSTIVPEQAGSLASWRLDYDREVMKRLAGFQSDLCVLAGYMLIVGAEMCQRYDMVNLHPAAPGGPAGTWQEVIWRLIEERAEQTGVMMHLVTPELDRGPVVSYCTFSIRGGPFDRYWREIEGYSATRLKERDGEKNRLFKLIRRQGLAREFPLIVATIKAFSEGKVRVNHDRKIVDVEGRSIGGYDLTDEINGLLKTVKNKNGE